MNVYNQIPKSGKFLGIDYGAKKVGIAISDPLRILLPLMIQLYLIHKKNY